MQERTPKLRHHKATNQSFVELNGKRIYLGVHGRAETKAKYDRVVGEWLRAGRTLRVDPDELTVTEMVAAFMLHAKVFYVLPDGRQSSEYTLYACAVKPMLKLYGSAAAVTFKALALQTVRSEMIDKGWARKSINKHILRIKKVFKWAAGQELIPGECYTNLIPVEGLKKNRSKARETEPVRPVDPHTVETTKRFLSPVIRAMIDMQLLTGARPGEVCSMRGCDLNMDNQVWVFTPEQHKNSHRDQSRKVFIGPKAQQVLRPYLKTSFLFTPIESESWHREQRTAKRKTPATYGNSVGTNLKKNPRWKPSERFAVTSYARAIRRAAILADQWVKGGIVIGDDERLIPHWHPHQIRHTAATRLRREFGVEAVQTILGHKNVAVTELYAEQDEEAARAVMLQVG